MQDLGAAGFHYITAITKPQIESLLRQGVIQMELFDEELAEVIPDDSGDGADEDRAVCRRYVLRRNPQRAAEMAFSRNDKRTSVERQVRQWNAYLREHPRASVATAHRKVAAKIARLKLGGWLSVLSEGRLLVLQEDAATLAESSKLDGCYCLTTDLNREQASKNTVHDRYKDLAQVEWAFRTSKTSHLELRPIHVRKESRTRGHALVVMLAYRLIQELARRWRTLDIKVEEGLTSLATLCATEVQLSDSSPVVNEIPRPRASIAHLISFAGVSLPAAIPSKGVCVSTKKKLPPRRK